MGNGVMAATEKSAYSSLSDLRRYLLSTESSYSEDIEMAAPDRRESARNLVHYLALRRQDIRSLQVLLSSLGLSSLGRLEAHVLAGIETVLFALGRMAGEAVDREFDRPSPTDLVNGDHLLKQHTQELFGPPYSGRMVRIMATMPSEAAVDYRLVRDLMEAGMDVVRINSAHDGEPAWQMMVQHVRRAEKELNRRCRILFDLCGPKLRTGNLAPGPAVLHVKPVRDDRGTVVEPALIWIGSGQLPPSQRQATAAVPVDEDLVEAIETGDVIRFRDLRGRSREFSVLEKTPAGAWVECRESAYLESALPLNLLRRGRTISSGTVGLLPPLEVSLRLHEGDTLILTSDGQLGRPAELGPDGSVREPARIPCTIPSVFSDIRKGDPILFDDGKISGTVEDVSSQAVNVKIVRALPGGTKLRSDKGINLPKTRLSLPSLTPEDLKNLAFAVNHADMVGFSFVHEASDLIELQSELRKLDKDGFGIVLKIENRVAFENLAQLLLVGLRKPPVGVMVARGDLGVEIGFERLAEVQEQILWICEAAHVPVIWATQVLETLAKKGLPSRAEVTDAAMSGRAECVMLNKGPYILQTVQFLDRILVCMRDHHHKKTPMLRRLKVSEGRFVAKQP